MLRVQSEAKRLHKIFPEREYRSGVPAEHVMPQRPAQEPVHHRPAQESASFQSQEIQIPRKQLEWKYPQMPEEPVQPKEPFVPNVPVPADSVAVKCWEANIEVEVNQDFFGTGQLIEPAEIRLGDCFMTGDDVSSRVLVFNVELHQCGSSLQVSGVKSAKPTWFVYFDIWLMLSLGI